MEIKHGSLTGYSGGKCRCLQCVEAWRVYQKEYRQRPGFKAKHNEYQKGRHARRMATDPEYQEWRRQISRKSAAKIRSTPEGRAKNNARAQDFRQQRRRWLQQIKVTRGCVDCGYNTHPEALEFDHVGTDKRFMLSRQWHSLEELKAEIEKCEVVCANCHRIRTYNRRQNKIQQS
jgi:hypothetical protein